MQSPFSPKPLSDSAGADRDEISLDASDFKLAKSFAKQLSEKRSLHSIMSEYHQSNFSRAFRLWVKNVLWDARAAGEDLPQALRNSFNEAAKGPSSTKTALGRAAGGAGG